MADFFTVEFEWNSCIFQKDVQLERSRLFKGGARHSYRQDYITMRHA
jgi:hypothetical protein